MTFRALALSRFRDWFGAKSIGGRETYARDEVGTHRRRSNPPLALPTRRRAFETVSPFQPHQAPEMSLLSLFDVSLIGRAGQAALECDQPGGVRMNLKFGELEERSN